MGLVTNGWAFVDDFSKKVPKATLSVSKLDWPALMYYWVNITLFTFSMTFVIQEVVNSQKTFFSIMFIFILSSFFFGGIFSSTILIDKDTHKLTHLSGADYDQFSQKEAVGLLKPWLVWQPMWWISQLFPSYGLNQTSSHIFDSAISGGSFNPEQIALWGKISILHQTFFSKDPIILYYVVAPWVWMLFGLWLGGFINSKKEHD